ncbi:MAG: M28 family peptidase, partial [Candidatus Kapabacteria bacterium]|nr:M28 family peptidase [Candidatus Kapabacteria bacterium]
AAPDIVSRIWQLGSQHASQYFVNEVGGAITDDHVPLINAGIPAVDIIDMELVGNSSTNPRRRYWHTQYDTMSNIGENTLNAVGTVLLHLLYEQQ